MGQAAARSGWIAALLLAVPLAVQAQAVDADAVKARVALTIARFAQLPESRGGGPIRLCVAVRRPAPTAIVELSRQKVGTRTIELQLGPPFDGCELLYVHSSYEPWRVLLDRMGGEALTVGDVPGFLAAGGMVELVIDSDAVRFDVNLKALRRKRIRLPAQVLSLARQVRE